MPELFQEIFAASCVLMPREPDRTASALFLPGRAMGDWESGPQDQGLLMRAAEIHHRSSDDPSLAVTIVLNGEPNKDAEGNIKPYSYKGPDSWKEGLHLVGVPHAKILTTRGGQNTGDESQAFVEFSQEHNIRRAMLLTNPHQLLRAMMTFVRAMQCVGYWLTIIPVAPKLVSWETLCFGSQGEKKLPRYAHAFEEAARIRAYVDNGWICTFEDLRRYVAHYL